MMNGEETYGEFPGVKEVVVGVGAEGDECGGELAGRDRDHAQQDEDPEAVTDDLELPPHAEVLAEDRLHVGLLLEHRREVLQPEDVQMAYQA